MRATSTKRTRKEARKTSKESSEVQEFKVRGGPSRADEPPGRNPLLDGERALHAGLVVAGERTQERILTGGRNLERDFDGFAGARERRVGDDVGLLLGRDEVGGAGVHAGLGELGH